tara:strand:- start:6499 stop:9207 length:2709 start_codon:yes stop_codon:yes gene_type:complete
MASLIGKADSTLVTAAAREGLSNVPGDYSKQFGIMADANKTLLVGVEKAFKQYEADKKASKKELEDAVKDLKTYGVGIENNADYNMFSDEMDAQVAIWKENGGFQNDSKGLREWERQNNKIMSKYKSNQTSLIEALEKFEDTDSWIGGLEPGDNKFLTSLIKYAKNVDDKSGAHNAKANDYMSNNTGASTDKTPEQLWKYLGVEEGEVVKYLDPATNEFSYITSIDGKVVSKKSSELSEMIPPKAIKPEIAIHTEINTKIDTSKGTYSDNDSQRTQNWLETLIDNATEGNPRALEYLMGQKYGGMKTSFVDALRDGTAEISPAIIKSLGGVGYLGDKNKDGKMDEGDFVTTENYNAMVDKILYGEDTYELRRNLFVDDVDNRGFRPGIEQKAQEGKFNTLESFLASKKQIFTKYGTWASPQALYGASQQIQDRLDGTIGDEWYESGLSNNRYKLEDGQWYKQIPDDSGNGWSKKRKQTLNQVKSDLSLSDYDSVLFPGQKKAAVVNEEGDIEGINKPEIKRARTTNVITDYEKRDGKWYYIKDGENIAVDKSNYPRLEAQAAQKAPETAPSDSTVVQETPVDISDPSTVVTDDMATNKYTGQGTYTWESGDNYVGEWKDGLKNGQGAYIWKDNGDKYVGGFKDDTMHGKGVWTLEGEEEVSWYWEGNELDGGEKEFLEKQKGSKKKETTKEVVTAEVENAEDQVAGPNNPDPMFGSSSTDGTQMMGSNGEWVKIGSKAYYKDLGIKSKKGKDFVNREGVMKKVNEIASNHGFNVRELLNVIQKESNFDPATVNKKSGATGLIQFFADRGKDYKTIGGTQYKIADIKKMPIVEQLDLINKYFEENHKNGQHPYITIAYPKAHNMKLDDIIATSDSVIAKQNPVWVNDDGNVTKRSIIEYAEGV